MEEWHNDGKCSFGVSWQMLSGISYQSVTNIVIITTTRNDGDASILEQVKRPNPWRKMITATTTTTYYCN
jgi:hypothetical protein